MAQAITVCLPACGLHSGHQHAFREVITQVAVVYIVALPAPVTNAQQRSQHDAACMDFYLTVQGMMANRYMNTFRDEILGWNKKLMNVADVNQIITEIQRTWAYLESLFIHSEEVKKELPEAAVRFANIDKEVKIILKV